MLLQIYSIYDSKAHVYSRPVYLLNADVAHRAALDALQDKSTDLARHPEDFIMFHLGTWDDADCSFGLFDAPAVMFRFHELQIPLPLGNG